MLVWSWLVAGTCLHCVVYVPGQSTLVKLQTQDPTLRSPLLTESNTWTLLSERVEAASCCWDPGLTVIALGCITRADVNSMLHVLGGI